MRANLAFTFLTASGLTFAAASQGGIAPMYNASHLFAKATAGADVHEDVEDANVSGSWNGYANAVAQEGGTSFTTGIAFLNSTVDSTCLSGSGSTQASCAGPGTSWTCQSFLGLPFEVTQVQHFSGYMSIVIPPDSVPGEVYVTLKNPSNDVYYTQTSPGEVYLDGRIAPGTYLLIASTSAENATESGSLPQFTVQMCFDPVTDSFIGQQPLDQAVPPGVLIDLVITPATQAPRVAAVGATPTYQWRKNLVPLADGGRLSGTQTTHLSIQNAAYSDSGRYDCVVTEGTVAEPSRQAKVIVGTTSVDGPAPVANLELSAPRPNPFHELTELRLSLPRSSRIEAGIFDLLGRRVKSLWSGERLEAGEHVLAWDGTADSGARAPGGVYFVRVVADGATAVRRAVLVTGGR